MPQEQTDYSGCVLLDADKGLDWMPGGCSEKRGFICSFGEFGMSPYRISHKMSMEQAKPHTHARTHARTHVRWHPRTHSRTHARTHGG